MVLFVASFISLCAAFFIAARVYQASEAKRLGFLASDNFKKFVPDYAPRLGASNPRVYLVEFLDPECESCREFYPYVKMILDEFKDDVQLVVRYAPFHGNSKFIIKVLEASKKQDKYWEALELLFQFQPQWGSHHHPQPELIWNYLPQIGLDTDKIKRDMLNPEYEKMINNEITDGQELGVRGTPTFFINGKPLTSFSYEQLKLQIQQALDESSN